MTEPANDFLHKVFPSYFHNDIKIFLEREIVFISNLEDITRKHYLELPKSMHCRKLIRRFHESTPLDFEYKWLKESFKDL